MTVKQVYPFFMQYTLFSNVLLVFYLFLCIIILDFSAYPSILLCDELPDTWATHVINP